MLKTGALNASGEKHRTRTSKLNYIDFSIINIIIIISIVAGSCLCMTHWRARARVRALPDSRRRLRRGHGDGDDDVLGLQEAPRSAPPPGACVFGPPETSKNEPPGVLEMSK